MNKLKGEKVYVLKGWNARTGRVTLKVYTSRKVAKAQQDKLLVKKGKTYAGVVACKIR